MTRLLSISALLILPMSTASFATVTAGNAACEASTAAQAAGVINDDYDAGSTALAQSSATNPPTSGASSSTAMATAYATSSSDYFIGSIGLLNASGTGYQAGVLSAEGSQTFAAEGSRTFTGTLAAEGSRTRTGGTLSDTYVTISAGQSALTAYYFASSNEWIVFGQVETASGTQNVFDIQSGDVDIEYSFEETVSNANFSVSTYVQGGHDGNDSGAVLMATCQLSTN